MAFDYPALQTLVRTLARDTDASNYSVSDPQQITLIAKAIINYIRKIARTRPAYYASTSISGAPAAGYTNMPIATVALDINEFLALYAAPDRGVTFAYPPQNSGITADLVPRLEKITEWEMDELWNLYPPGTANDPWGSVPRFYSATKPDSGAAWQIRLWPFGAANSIRLAAIVLRDYADDGTLPQLEQDEYRIIACLAALDHGKLAGLSDDDLTAIQEEIPADVQQALGLHVRQKGRPARVNPDSPVV